MGLFSKNTKEEIFWSWFEKIKSKEEAFKVIFKKNSIKKMSLHVIFTQALLVMLLSSCSNEYGNVETYTVVSAANGTSYKIQVLTPHDYNPGNSYPVVYLLDPNFHFTTLKLILGELKSDSLISDVILVGIDYTGTNNRGYDYSFPQSSVDLGFTSGGGELFHTFLRDELVPFVEARYSSNTSARTIMGHSLGGYFSLYSLFNHYITSDTPFTNYISLSPGIWYEDSYLLGEEIATKAFTSDLNVSLYIGYGIFEGSAMAGPVKAMNNQLSSSAYNNIKYKLNSFEKGHLSVVPPAARDALVFLFGI